MLRGAATGATIWETQHCDVNELLSSCMQMFIYGPRAQRLPSAPRGEKLTLKRYAQLDITPEWPSFPEGYVSQMSALPHATISPCWHAGSACILTLGCFFNAYGHFAGGFW